MEVRFIEERAYIQMMRHFESFVIEIREICKKPELSKEWLDGQDVCIMLQISKRTLQYYRDSGKMKFSQIGNKYYYKISDIERLINDSLIK